MKFIGMLALIASSTGLGFHFFKLERERVEICDELYSMCEGLMIDLGYSVTPATKLVNDICKQYKHISIINDEYVKSKKNLSLRLRNDENSEVSKFLYSLGKSDLKTQRVLVNGFKEYVAQLRNKYKKELDKNGRLYICFCSFSGIILSLVLF